jgi:hypothetical protein
MSGSPHRPGRHAARWVLQLALLLGAPGVRAQDSSETQTVYFGSGCFWGRQKDFVDVEEITLGRSDQDVTALVGYAGGPVPKGALHLNPPKPSGRATRDACVVCATHPLPASCAPQCTWPHPVRCRVRGAPLPFWGSRRGALRAQHPQSTPSLLAPLTGRGLLARVQFSTRHSPGCATMERRPTPYTTTWATRR